MKSWNITACLSNIDLVCSELAAWLNEQGLSAELFPMELLAREALNNAIIHGCAQDPAHHVCCDVQNIENTLRLHFKHDGIGFAWQEHLQKEQISVDNESGRGIQIYRLYADSLEFNQCGNQVTLVRQLNREGRTHMEIKTMTDGNQCLCLDTDLTAVNVPEFRAQIQTLIQDGTQELVIDLGQTRVIDSMGIGLLVAAHNSLRRLHGSLSLVNVSKDLLDLLKAFRLDKHFSISGAPELG
jgi:anti-anti-sigma factor